MPAVNTAVVNAVNMRRMAIKALICYNESATLWRPNNYAVECVIKYPSKSVGNRTKQQHLRRIAIVLFTGDIVVIVPRIAIYR